MAELKNQKEVYDAIAAENLKCAFAAASGFIKGMEVLSEKGGMVTKKKKRFLRKAEITQSPRISFKISSTSNHTNACINIHTNIPDPIDDEELRRFLAGDKEFKEVDGQLFRTGDENLKIQIYVAGDGYGGGHVQASDLFLSVDDPQAVKTTMDKVKMKAVRAKMLEP